MKWSAGWGSACDPCAKAKTRCIRKENETKCSRCQSLDITCKQQARKPRKRRARQTASTLPEFAIPQLGHGRGSSSTISPPQTGGPPFPSPDASAATSEDPGNHAADPEPNIYVAQVKVEVTAPFSASTTLPGFHPFPTPTCTCLWESSGKDSPEPTESEEELLSIYRTRLSPQFPFVIIPDGVTAAELHKSRPFLAKAVMMAATLRNRWSMWKQSRLLLRHISDAVFMGPDRSLDLLQGIIVFLGFYHYFCFAHGHFNNLSHLASSMIADMRLDRPRAKPPSRNKDIHGIDPEEPKAMLNDERRAILAVWYINSSSAVGFKKVNSPGRYFTQHMERQLQDLQSGPEYETDKALVQLICAQRINEMIAQRYQSDQPVDIRPSSNVWTARLDNLLSDLNDLRGRDPQYKTHRHLVSSHYNSALLQLLEPQLVDVNDFQEDGAVAALHHTPDYFRVVSNSRKDVADTALRAWFEDWLTIPVCHFFYLPMSAYLQLTNAVVILLRRSRLLLTRHPIGDFYPPQMGINGVPFASVDAGSSNDLMLSLLDRLALRFEEARKEMAAAHCSEWANDFLDLVSWKLRERKACIEKWMKIIAEAQLNAPSGVEAGGSLGNGGDLTASFNMDEPTLWLDSLDELLVGADAYESWL